MYACGRERERAAGISHTKDNFVYRNKCTYPTMSTLKSWQRQNSMKNLINKKMIMM